MNFPFYINIADTKILLHPIYETVGMFIGFRYYLYLRKKQSDAIENSNRIWIIIAAIFGAVIGSRLIGALENPDALYAAKNIWLYIYTNKTVVGGFLGGLFGVEFVKKIIVEKKASGDLFAYPIILALIIGRMGCFSMGVFEETYGLPTNFFTGINLGDGIVRHPVMLYEISFLLLAWMMFKQLQKKYLFIEGAIFKIFMITYLLFRFCIDFIKPHYTFNIGLSTIQVTCLLGLAYYYRYLLNSSLLLKK